MIGRSWKGKWDDKALSQSLKKLELSHNLLLFLFLVLKL
jgi:hypothetical protein